MERRTRVRTAKRSARVDARVPERASRNMVYMVVISSSSFTSARRCASTNATAALKLCWLQTAALMKDDSIGSARAFSLASRLHVHPCCGQVPPSCAFRLQSGDAEATRAAARLAVPEPHLIIY